MPARPRVAIVGATGAVGREFLELLVEREFPYAELRLLASERSAGRELHVGGEVCVVQELRPESFEGIDLAFFSCGSGRAREFAPHALRSGAFVVDNSSAFRMDEGVPLVVPEVNASALEPLLAGQGDALIANPNCSTILLVQTLAPIHARFGLRRVIASTYQAASGAGQQAMNALVADLRELLAPGQDGAESPGYAKAHFGHELAFNVVPQIDVFDEQGRTGEELKMQRETRKILELPGLRIDVTCVRVPVLRSHSESVTLQSHEPISVEELRELFAATSGLCVVDSPEARRYPMPLDASGQDETLVGRIRPSEVFDSGISYWLSGDQLRKGAALNGIQIAETLIKASGSSAP
jgi:aspartate-semialdehyde dehydrogenase